MTTTIRLRRWQQRALQRLAAAQGPDFLTVATPGAGKTTFALVALRQRMAQPDAQRVVIVAPTAHLKSQWSAAAAKFGIVLEDRWRPADGPLPLDVHGIVTTYQQVASASRPVASLANGGLVILDEIHHAGDERAWGQGIRDAFGGATWRLALSGTPFRSDANAIPFVRYALDEALPDFEYGYGDALADSGVIRQISFPALDGEMEWIGADGSAHRASFSDELTSSLAAQRLRTALSVDGEWLPAVIDAAHASLIQTRRTHPDAGGLVIATDQEHAHEIAGLLRRDHGVSAGVAISDDRDASAKIARFRASDDPWLVAVRMVSEGVDIPRLAVGVYATTTATELFFRQAVGRFVRARRGDGNLVASLFIPPDRRLRAHASEITAVRRHHLARNAHRSNESAQAATDSAEEQMSLFAALSATPIGPVAPVHAASTDGDVGAEDTCDDGILLELPALPPRAGTAATAQPDAASPPRRRHRELRTLNAARAADLVHHTNLSHASVNAELNRLAGIQRITEATEAQLEQRLGVAERWLRGQTAGFSGR